MGSGSGSRSWAMGAGAEWPFASGCNAEKSSSERTELGAGGSDGLEGASEGAALGDEALAMARRLITVGRMRSSTVSCVRCFSR